MSSVYLAVALLVLANSARAVTFSWSTVGDVGNIADPGNTASPNARGSVSYSYRIAHHEVTNAQYAEFLNAVAAADPNELYHPSMGSDAVYGGINRVGMSGNYSYSVKPTFSNKPVTYVGWFDAARFTNWLHNGQGAGSTEFGAYWLINTDTMTILEPTRMSGAQYFLPTEDEWYKAAYYHPGSAAANADNYWFYPTQSDVGPISGPPPGGTNSANYNGSSLTDVGGYLGSSSHYGAFDMGGNVWEWNEAIPQSGQRQLRGGSFLNSTAQVMTSSFDIAFPSTTALQSVGFRVAAVVPEPSVLYFLSLALFLFAARTRKKNRN